MVFVSGEAKKDEVDGGKDEAVTERRSSRVDGCGPSLGGPPDGPVLTDFGASLLAVRPAARAGAEGPKLLLNKRVPCCVNIVR